MQKSQKSQKKKKKKIFMGRFPMRFSISVDKKGGKSKWFCFFSVRGEEKCEINYKKGSFFTIFVC